MSFSDSIPLNFTATDQTELLATGAWHFVRQKLHSSNSMDNSISTQTEIGPECSSTKVKPIDRIYFENNIDFLDSEGEWFLDNETKVLSLYSTSDPNESKYSYPVVGTLFNIKGEESTP